MRALRRALQQAPTAPSAGCGSFSASIPAPKASPAASLRFSIRRRLPIVLRIRSNSSLRTCNRCLHHSAPSPIQFHHIPRSTFLTTSSFRNSATPFTATDATGQSPPIDLPNSASVRRRRKLILTILAGAAVLGGLGYEWNDLKHAAHAAERAGRVAIALAICIKDYRTTLTAAEENPEKRDQLLSACHQRCAARTYKVLEKNGSIFIKLGQHLAAMGYLLPTEWTTAFIPLQDKCPVSSYESIEQMIKNDTGYSIEELFDEFDPHPIGAASLAQVHRAKLKAVKLQHPALAEWIPLDIALTRFTFRNIKFFFPEYPLEWLSDEIEASLPQELNFTSEATNIARMRIHFAPISPRVCPLVLPTVMLAFPRILVMEYLPGHRLDDLRFMDEAGISRDEVSAALARIFNEMVFGSNAPLHCDPHGGNLAIRINDSRRVGGWWWSKFLPWGHGSRGFDIILYDHGLYRDIPTSLRRSYAKLWLAVLDADEGKMRQYAKEVAGISDEQFPLFASAITGREYAVIVPSSPSSGIASTPRTETERAAISAALISGPTAPGSTPMLAQLMQLLSHVPRVILLILKTNDLTRSLDESLKTSWAGSEKVWLILARYCARTVYEEEMEEVWGRVRGWERWWRWVTAVARYWWVVVKLRGFEVLVELKGRRRGKEVEGVGVSTDVGAGKEISMA
ncbi:ABC1 family-domain-containing protein [Kalaharituber pfeilii]|nr:ABC1 family-domain-containing protein [Kalaharituber pfeilii]